MKTKMLQKPGFAIALALSSSALFAQQVEGEVIAPAQLAPDKPFTFAVAGVVEGEVIQIKTEDGNTISTGKTDHLGRVFVAAGLAFGTYRVFDGDKYCGGYKVQKASPMLINAIRLPKTIDQTQNCAISGQGMNPNAARNLVQLGSGEPCPVLAASENQIILAKVESAHMGNQMLSIANADSGISAGPQPCFVYRISAMLEEKQLVRPARSETHLQIVCEPGDSDVHIRVSANGPVNFGKGSKTTEVVTHGGLADVRIYADPSGTGTYHLRCALAEAPNMPDLLPTPVTDESLSGVVASDSMPSLDAAINLKNSSSMAKATDTAASFVGGVAKKVFLDWWKDYLEAYFAYEMIDGYVVGPNDRDEDKVRTKARNQVVALTDGAKKKLIKRLKDRAKELRDRANKLRAEGKSQAADRADQQAQGMDWAADEIQKGMSR